MITTFWFDQVPLWGHFLGTIAVVVFSITAGYKFGLWRRKTIAHLEGPVGTIVGAMLGLLAFILAFTFGMSASRFDSRKELLLEEANAIQTAFYRAGLIDKSHRSVCLELLKEYSNVRSSVSRQSEKMKEIVVESRKLQTDIWQQASEYIHAGHNTDIDASFIESLNDMMAIFNKRLVVGLQFRIPPMVWYVLFLLTVLTMIGVGHQFGLAGKNSYIVYSFLAIGFAAVITMIVALDGTMRGSMTVNQRPMIELSERLNAIEIKK